MSTVPKITQEHLDAAADQMSGYELMLDFVNKVIELANAEQQEITEFAKKRSGMEFDEWQGKPFVLR